MRVFLDTNVLASAFGTRGLCLDLVRHVLDEHDAVVSDVVLRELEKALKDKFRVPAAGREAAPLALLECAVVNPPVDASLPDCPDPADAPILAAALEARAEVFVTGDRALLELREVQGMAILSPRGFWERLPKHAG
ncbi:MAG: putative toxin-antitoxin system toxin component, PIN family [Pseudomonadota bacterium]|nr:putative toxin-antitoxin system toxin component, PIN family [Pseudomonadota bacterium]